MSKTIRRVHLNKQKHFVSYYWTSYTEKDLWFIESWKYHSDNYYNKKHKDLKQFFNNQLEREFRQDFKQKINHFLKTDNYEDDMIFNYHKPRKSIRYYL
jgi:hypothetical protein